MAKLGEVRIRETFIPGDVKGEIVYGQYTSDGKVEINPVPAITETIIHECLHALKPNWSEPTVERFTTYLFQRLTEDEMQTIYRVYRKRLNGRRCGEE